MESYPDIMLILFISTPLDFVKQPVYKDGGQYFYARNGILTLLGIINSLIAVRVDGLSADVVNCHVKFVDGGIS